MVSSYTVVNPSSACRAFAVAPCFAKLTYSHAALALPPPCRSRSVRAVRPASLAASARHSICQQSPLKAGAPCRHAWASHASETASFGHAGLAVQAPVLKHLARLPVSQRLKPQSSMIERFCTSHFSSATQRVCRSLSARGRRTPSRVSLLKQERVGSQQTPNPSFKRTHKGLRPLRSA